MKSESIFEENEIQVKIFCVVNCLVFLQKEKTNSGKVAKCTIFYFGDYSYPIFRFELIS